MTALVLKVLNGCKKRPLKIINYNILRRSSTDDPCSPKDQAKQEPCTPCQAKKPESASPEACAPKPEPCPPKPDPCQQQPTAMKCSEPPPCPSIPRCPPVVCPSVKDTNNPCNYCPPTCIDPDAADMVRIKKYQCFFQQNDDVPVYMKRGTVDVVFFQFALFMVLGCAISHIYSMCTH